MLIEWLMPDWCRQIKIGDHCLTLHGLKNAVAPVSVSSILLDTTTVNTESHINIVWQWWYLSHFYRWPANICNPLSTPPYLAHSLSTCQLLWMVTDAKWKDQGSPSLGILVLDTVSKQKGFFDVKQHDMHRAGFCSHLVEGNLQPQDRTHYPKLES